MKLKNTHILYIYVAFLFVLTYFFTSRLIKSFKAEEFDYLRLGVNLVLIIYIIIKVVKLGKIENDKLDKPE